MRTHQERGWVRRTLIQTLVVVTLLGCVTNNSESVLFNHTPLPNDRLRSTEPGVRVDKHFGESPNYVDVLVIDRVVKLQLTEHSILAFVSDIAIIENRILVLDRKQVQLFLFSLDGEFLKLVGRPGEGPGEYIKPEYIASNESQFLVLDTDKKSIMYYDKSGDWISKDDLSKSGIHPINDFLLINDRAYFPNPLYTLSKNIELPVNLIYDTSEKKILWGFEKRFPPFYKKNPPFRIHYTSFSRVADSVWFGPPHTSEVFIYDLDGRFVKKVLPGIPDALALEDFEGASNQEDFTKVWRSKHRNSRVFHVPPIVLTTFSGSFQSAFERMSIFDESGNNLVKNFKTKNTVLFNRLLLAHSSHIVGAVDIDFFNEKALETFLTDQQKAKFVDAGWDETSTADNEDNPYLVFFKVDL